MKDLVMITPPPVEPVLVKDMLTQLGMVSPADSVLSALLTAQLGAAITAARAYCENYCRRAFITQTWLLRLDSFPGHDFRYEWNGYPQINLPNPPFQSVQFLKYVDVSGTMQTLTVDTTYGANPANPQYGYQLDRGSETQPARLLPPFARPWPPTRLVPANVLVQFRCGYGGPLTVSIEAGSAALTGASFNPDDAPLLTGDAGLAISIPGAGVNGAALSTSIASVDANGNATLASAAQTTVSGSVAWAGTQVPTEIMQAIRFLAQWFYEQGSVVDQAMPRVVMSLIDPYRNMVA